MNEPTPPTTLADYRRGILRDAFHTAVGARRVRPLLLPWSLVPALLLPAVYVAVAGRHVRLRAARVPFSVAMAAVQAWTVVAGTTSRNFASAYGAGLAAAWSTLWLLAVLVWTDPWAGARVQAIMQSTSTAIGSADDPPDIPDTDIAHCRRTGYVFVWQSFPADASLSGRLAWSLDRMLAWRGPGWSFCCAPIPHANAHDSDPLAAIPESTPAAFRRYRTHVAFFRATLPRLVFAYLALDLCAILMTCDPYFVLGPPPDATRPWSAQPDAVLRPLGAPPPPPALLASPRLVAALERHHPGLLGLCRSTLALVGIYAAITLVLGLVQALSVALGCLWRTCASVLSPGPAVTPVALQLWQYPTIFGGLGAVPARGLAGVWGVWWHQTFRVAFVAPVTPVLRHCQNHQRQKARVLVLVSAFVQSGMLHAAGSITSLPARTVPGHGTLARWWAPPLFFSLSAVGIVIEAWAVRSLAAVFSRWPVLGRRRLLASVARTVFALAWLYATQSLLLDDLAYSGIWLFEPVPWSGVRWLLAAVSSSKTLQPPTPRSNRAGHAAWRWYRDDLAYWHAGAHWWETGWAL